MLGATLHGSSARFAAILGSGHPDVFRVRVTGRVQNAAPPRLVLRAEPTIDVPGLRPPLGRTWRQALRAGLVARDGRRLLGTAVKAMLGLARVNQYRTFLQTPGLPEQAHTTYTWVTVTGTAIAASSRSNDDGSDGALNSVLVIGIALLGMGAAVTLWAHL